MRSPLPNLAALAALAEMQHDAAMAELSRHNRRLNDLEAHISNLRQQRLTPPSPAPDHSLPLSMTSGHFDLWQRWIEGELIKLNTKLSRARADREAVIRNARSAFGRKMATDALLRREKEATRIKARRQQEQGFWQEETGKNPLSF